MRLALLLLGFGGLLAAAPAITSAGPCQIDVNSPEFMLSVAGSGFVPGSVVKWAGASLSTTLLSPTLLTATVPAALLTNSGKFTLTVTNPDASVSGSFGCVVQPVLNNVTPGIHAVGRPATTITASGIGFRSSTAMAIGLPAGRLVLATTFVNSTTLTAVVPASALAATGAFNIYPYDTADDFAARPVAFYVNGPEIVTIFPTSVTAGGPGFVLAVYGSLSPTSVVRWNGTPLATTYSASAGNLTATVPANLIATPGTAAITIASGSYVSAAHNLTIAAGLAPILSSMAPTSMLAGSPAFTLGVSGANFVSGSIVRWGATPLATVFVDSGRLNATVPPSLLVLPGADITVANPGGGVSRALGFSVIPVRPTITSVTPPSVPAGSPTLPLTIHGTGFVAGQTAVEFNGIGVAASVNSPTQLTATVPGNYFVAGTVNITVSILGVYSAPFPFTIAPPTPVITALLPSSATAGGAAFTLTVSGNHYTSGSVVQWNGAPLTTTFVSVGELKATVPAALIADTGIAGVTVVNPGGPVSTAANLPIQSQVPRLLSLTPSSAMSGGPAFTLAAFGSGFLPGSRILWNGSPLTTTYISPTDLTASVPAGSIASAGTVQVTVLNPGGAASQIALFNIGAVSTPVIIGYSAPPVAGSPGFTMTVSGSGFLNGAVVQWNGSALPTTFVSATQLSATVSAALIANAGTALLTITQHGVSSTPAIVTILSATPTIVSLDPSTVTAGGPSFTLKVNGTGYGAGGVVLWNGAALGTTQISSTLQHVSVPGGLILTPGTVSIVVRNGTAESAPATLTIVEPVPAITALGPASATAGGAAFTMTVTGSGFLAGATVQWNGTALVSTFVHSGNLTAQVPASLIAAAGTAAVQVANPSGARSGNATFTIAAPNRTISGLAPPSATAGGAAFTLIVTGAGFTEGSVVQWNGVALPTTFSGATQLQAAVSAVQIANTASVNITVVNPGSPASDPVVFTVNPATPRITSISPTSATAGSPAFTLTVTGADFAAGAVIRWNGAPLVTTRIDSAHVSANVPPGLIANAGTALVTVSNGSANSASATFTVNLPAPVVSWVTPGTAAAGGPAIAVTVFGNHFTPTSAVRWNGASLPTSFVNGTMLTATVSAALIARPGTAFLTVANGDLISTATTFEITNTAPVISSLTPASATAGGPAFTLTVNGAGFTAGSAIAWNGTPLTTTFVSAARLTATIPAASIAAPGAAAVTVSDLSGAVSLAVSFRVNPDNPVISSVTPDSLPSGSPESRITVTGSGFLAGSVVQWNGVSLATTFVRDSELTAIAPQSLFGTAGSVRISVVNPGGAQSPSVLLTVTAPTLSIVSFLPTAVTAGGPQLDLAVNGSGFVSGSVVRWKGSPLVTTFVNASRLVAWVAPELFTTPGEVAISVTNPNGDTAAATYPVNAANAVISALRPDRMTAGAPGFTLTVDGRGYLPGAVVLWNGEPLTTLFRSPTQLTASVAPEHIASPGTATITAIASSGQAPSAPVAFPIVALTVSAIDPPSAPARSPSLAIRINGTGFLAGAVAYWNSQALATTFVSAQTLMAIVPAPLLATELRATIRVSNPGGSVSPAREFSVGPALPRPTVAIESILTAAGTAGPIAPGSLISIYGANLATGTEVASTTPLPTELGGTVVTINGTPIPLLFTSPGQINAQAPFEIQAGRATLAVQASGETSIPWLFDVGATGPAVFTTGVHAFAMNAADWSLNSAANPARPGQYLVLYCTGQGAVEGAVTGMPPASVLAMPLGGVQAWIGGRPSTVTFAGLVPGFIGLLQVNVLVPAVEAGEQAFEIGIEGVASNTSLVSIGAN